MQTYDFMNPTGVFFTIELPSNEAAAKMYHLLSAEFNLCSVFNRTSGIFTGYWINLA